MDWPLLTDLCAVPPMNGLMEKRGGALVDADRAALEKRMRAYYDRRLDWEAYRRKGYGLTEPQAGFAPAAVRAKAQEAEAFDPDRIVRFLLRPFDVRWCCYTAVRPVWNSHRPSLWAKNWPGNRFLMVRRHSANAREGVPAFFSSCLPDAQVLGFASAIPLRLKNGERLNRRNEGLLFGAMGDRPDAGRPVANLSARARKYLAGLGIRDPDADEETAGLVWHHALAICCSPAYLAENAGAVRADWPRVPLPPTARALRASAGLGRRAAALMDSETPVFGVTGGRLEPRWRLVGAMAKDGGGQVDPGADDLKVTAGWGHAGKGGVVMPARGKAVRRAMSPAKRAAAGAGAGALTWDVYLNPRVYWKNISDAAWKYAIGGCQVIKKWLAYREHGLLGRPLSLGEAGHVTDMARRLAALAAMDVELDANYRTTCVL